GGKYIAVRVARTRSLLRAMPQCLCRGGQVSAQLPGWIISENLVGSNSSSVSQRRTAKFPFGGSHAGTLTMCFRRVSLHQRNRKQAANGGKPPKSRRHHNCQNLKQFATSSKNRRADDSDFLRIPASQPTSVLGAHSTVWRST